MENFNITTIEEISSDDFKKFENNIDGNNTNIIIEEIIEDNIKDENNENIEPCVNFEIDLNTEPIEKFSKYKYNIIKENCENCNIDTFTIIKDNEDFFNKFINCESEYINSIYGFLNKIKNIN